MLSLEEDALFGLFGGGGFGAEVMPLAKFYISTLCDQMSESGIEVVAVESEPKVDQLNGHRLISEFEFINTKCLRYFNVAIGSSTAREQIAERLKAFGCRPLSIFANSAIIYDNNKIGEGAMICDHVIITSNTKIGKFFQANIYSYVAHDCEIGDFVTFAPRVNCNGNVKVGNHAYIGTGAVIKQGNSEKPLEIGEGAIVGMGAVVTKDVPPYTTVVGNPARVLEKKRN